MAPTPLAPVNDGEPSPSSKSAIEEVRRAGIVALTKRQMPCPAAVAAHIAKCRASSREQAITAFLELLRVIGYTDAVEAFEKSVEVKRGRSRYLRFWEYKWRS